MVKGTNCGVRVGAESLALGDCKSMWVVVTRTQRDCLLLWERATRQELWPLVEVCSPLEVGLSREGSKCN